LGKITDLITRILERNAPLIFDVKKGLLNIKSP
jgi:hypothetical protein